MLPKKYLKSSPSLIIDNSEINSQNLNSENITNQVKSNELTINEESTTQSMVSLFENELEKHDQNPIDNNLNTINNDIKQINFENFIDDIALWPLSITDNFWEYFTLHPPNQNIQTIDESKKSIRGISRKLKKT
ncbi:uncharacterized protein LOC112691486 [Sipha flava]|uniref:Uncharacterized protein LOC112691486 n=1 Tax=Sipha flava TaxID=143950 RepID=A0A8B8GE72_9HEMI|nr:uncharacterized protein LOC112691486 [Sipha flava]